MSYITEIRTQYTFVTSWDKYVELLTYIVSPEVKVPVNIVGNSVQYKKDDKYLIKIVVGPTYGEQDPKGLTDQNAQFRSALKKYKIDYDIDKVIRVSRLASAEGIPGTTRVLYALLACSKIKVISIYSGEALEGNVLSYLVQIKGNLDKAFKVVSTFDATNEPDKHLCINVNNVAKKK